MQKKKKEHGKEARQFKTIHLALPVEIIERVDQQAEVESRNRVNMVAVLIQRALASPDKQPELQAG